MPEAEQDLNTLGRKAFEVGPHVGAYAAAVLEHPLPWTKMRQVYRLLGLARRHGHAAVDEACQQALEAEVVDVGVVDRMLTRGTPESGQLTLLPPPAPSRFVRSNADFSVRKPS